MGYNYWEKSSPYWNDLRSIWNEILTKSDEVKLRKELHGKKLFEYHFGNAQNDTILAMTTEKRKDFIRKLLASFMK